MERCDHIDVIILHRTCTHATGGRELIDDLGEELEELARILSSHLPSIGHVLLSVARTPTGNVGVGIHGGEGTYLNQKFPKEISVNSKFAP